MVRCFTSIFQTNIFEYEHCEYLFVSFVDFHRNFSSNKTGIILVEIKRQKEDPQLIDQKPVIAQFLPTPNPAPPKHPLKAYSSFKCIFLALHKYILGWALCILIYKLSRNSSKPQQIYFYLWIILHSWPCCVSLPCWIFCILVLQQKI